ncbi:MAG: hypothetical protein LKCHEGNO_01058 [Burkholderiaceae bacterium]|nr:hypothetical protein [Burkholderiaceae bacterium]
MASRNHALRSRAQALLRALALAPLALAGAASADTTDLSSLPLITSAPQIVKPNLMFILDDSGSMAWTHMPDTVEDFGQDGSGTKKYGYVSAQCNGVYYNPSITYLPPIQVSSTGTISSYADASFTAARVNGYDSGSTAVDLSTSFQAWSDGPTNSTVNNTNLDGTSDVAQPAYYYKYSGSQSTPTQKNYLDTTGTFYKECISNVGAAPGSGVFTLVTVSSTSGPSGTDERQNFANWFSYYRSRMLMMKTATGMAFRNIGSEFRVGYMTINNNKSPSFLNVTDFDATQKNAWYGKVYGASPNNSTPLQPALSNAGRMYANKLGSLYGQTVNDPVQYSCQKNFTLLSTDGYWNGPIGFREDGVTAVGNADAGEPAPYGDGGTAANGYTTTIVVTAATKFSEVSSIKVDGNEILSATANSTAYSGSRAERLATSIAAKINACIGGKTGNCAVAGYKATVSGTTIFLVAPAAAGALASAPVIASTSDAIFTAAAFANSAVAAGGTPDTLADVAMYYYNTDLRSTALGNETGALGNPVSDNNVLTGGDDAAPWQHMNTFTLGLGAPGRMIYSPTYPSDTSGDYYDVKTGAKNWPAPSANDPATIDDLWHAAVNGRGRYFAATNPNSLAVGLNSALQAVTAMTSDSAAATTSNPNVTAGDNYIYSSTFRSAEWWGELERRQIDANTGEVATAADWTAAAQLDANASRAIYTFDSGSSNKLKTFAWANLSSSGSPSEQDYFKTAYLQGVASYQGGKPALSQFCASGAICLSAGDQTSAGGAALVNFLRGDRANEGPADVTTKYFRERVHVLGDIVNSEAVYVKKPVFDYVDSGYAAFKTAQAGRTPMVYVGANDGMLHAFNSDTGAETWAYVPKLLFPTLYRLADKFYAANHQFYVDGSPTVGDAYFGGAWHTVLVGGFNGGGRGYYALDITDPASPKGLWEFSDANMGLSFGRPEITKLQDGTWVAIFTSGYNNVSPGDGQGYLYVVNLETGAVVKSIGTGVGSASAAVAGVCSTAPCPSGLGQIRAWVDNTRYDNTTTKVYGVDLFGNLWRFDVNGTGGAVLLATLSGPGGVRQSLTARPELGKVAGYPVVYVGTGRYLGGTDLASTDVQSIYAIKDSGANVGNPRSDVSATGFVKQTLTNDVCPTGSQFCLAGSTIRTGTSNGVNFATQKGWFVDLPGTRERATTDPQLALGTLTVTTNLLNPSACSVGGTSYVNFFDYRTGAPIQGASDMVSVLLGDALATRPVQLKFSDGKVRSLVRMSNNTWRTPNAPIPPSGIGTRRTSWRELIVE